MSSATDEIGAVLARVTGRKATLWERRLVPAILVVGATLLTLGNVLMLLLMIGMMPKNDFGRPLWSTIAYLRARTCTRPIMPLASRSTQIEP